MLMEDSQMIMRRINILIKRPEDTDLPCREWVAVDPSTDTGERFGLSGWTRPSMESKGPSESEAMKVNQRLEEGSAAFTGWREQQDLMWQAAEHESFLSAEDRVAQRIRTRRAMKAVANRRRPGTGRLPIGDAYYALVHRALREVHLEIVSMDTMDSVVSGGGVVPPVTDSGNDLLKAFARYLSPKVITHQSLRKDLVKWMKFKGNESGGGTVYDLVVQDDTEQGRHVACGGKRDDILKAHWE
jgi:hypothetical protein